MNKPGFYAIIPADVRYDNRLKANAKLLYGEITALSGKEGFCWAENVYFASLYKVSPETVSRWISQLQKYGYIDVIINKPAGNTRKITIDNNVNTYRQKSQDLLTKKSRPIDKKVKSIYDSITINNTINTDGSAISYLLENYSIRFEQEFLMPYYKEFKSKEQFDKFCQDYNDEVEQTEKVFGSWMVPMLKKYARNWINYRKNNNQNEVLSISGPQFKKIG